MKRSDLITGMKVTLRDGSVFTVICNYTYKGSPYNVLVDGKKEPGLFVEDYLDDLTMDPTNEILGLEYDRLLKDSSEYDIIKVEENGKVLWER